MRALVILIIALCVSTGHAMRCGNILITEGDYKIQLLQACGQPSSDTGGVVIYLNKDGGGMNYYIHTGTDNTIDNITYSRS